MTNILLEGYDINAPWLMDSLKPYVKPFHKAAIIFSVLSMFWYTFTRSFTKKALRKQCFFQRNKSTMWICEMRCAREIRLRRVKCLRAWVDLFHFTVSTSE